MTASDGVGTRRPAPPAGGPPVASIPPSRWWQVLLMAGSILVIVLLGGAALGLSMTSTCRIDAPAAACNRIKWMIDVDFFGQGFLGLVSLAILTRSRWTWGRRTALVVTVAVLAIGLDVLMRQLISASPANF